jgi:hypothetical protein
MQDTTSLLLPNDLQLLLPVMLGELRIMHQLPQLSSASPLPSSNGKTWQQAHQTTTRLRAPGRPAHPKI